MPGTKVKSKRQVGYLLSKGSPLSSGQKAKLEDELHSGSVKVEKGKKKPPKVRGKKRGRKHGGPMMVRV